MSGTSLEINGVNHEVVQLKEQIATLEQLLAVYEREALEKSGKLETAIGAIQEHARRLAISEARYRRLAQQKELLNRLVSQIRQSLDLDTVLETTVSEIRWLLQLDSCIFWWYLPESSSFQAVYESYAADGLQHLSQKRFTVSCNGDFSSSGVAERGAPDRKQEPGQPQTSVAAKSTERRSIALNALPYPEARALKDTFAVHSQLLLPTQTRSGRVGAIHCLRWQERCDWADDEVALLHEVASQLAIAIDQAELYDQSRTAMEQAQAQAHQLEKALQEIQKTPQLIQTEKMASLGQLVAGVAHEINNPVNFIHGNLIYASKYIEDLLDLMHLYKTEYPQPTPAICHKAQEIDLEFLQEDLPKLFASMQVGADRIREIVRSLRTFSRLDEAEVKAVDIHEGIDSTLMILQNRLKAKSDRPAIEIVKDYGALPPVHCYAGQLNQVFMNILTNAIDALEESVWQGASVENDSTSTDACPKIRICTQRGSHNWVVIRIADNGSGMTEDVKQRLFDPFFTTKSVGKGTGLGMSISYQLITETHGGQLYCTSSLGRGTEFVIEIPVQQTRFS